MVNLSEMSAEERYKLSDKWDSFIKEFRPAYKASLKDKNDKRLEKLIGKLTISEEGAFLVARAVVDVNLSR